MKTMKNKIQLNTRHKFPYTSKQPQFLTVPEDWDKWVMNYASVSAQVWNAHFSITKEQAKNMVIKSCQDIEALYGTNSKIMGIAKLRKKYKALLTSFPKTVEKIAE